MGLIITIVLVIMFFEPIVYLLMIGAAISAVLFALGVCLLPFVYIFGR